ncbi:MAG: hypothetical protein ACE5IY_15690 [bacterium]
MSGARPRSPRPAFCRRAADEPGFVLAGKGAVQRAGEEARGARGGPRRAALRLERGLAAGTE